MKILLILMAVMDVPLLAAVQAAHPIDRQAVVSRHNITMTGFDPLSPLSVGNGQFAFTADLTGLQTFPELYEKGTPLVTMSQWGWHSVPLPAELNGEEFRYADWETFGRKVGYDTSKTGQETLFNYLRENPHKFHLGRIALGMKHPDGSAVKPEDLKSTTQTLDLWTGILTSQFELDGKAVAVQTCCLGATDAVTVRIKSPLVASGQVSAELLFAYPSPDRGGADWSKSVSHKTEIVHHDAGGVENPINLRRTVDGETYAVDVSLGASTSCEQRDRHFFKFGSTSDTIDLTCVFGRNNAVEVVPTGQSAQSTSRAFWKSFWSTGGAIDLSGSSDARWMELERRIVLSQYLTRVNCAGDLPPQETGLVCNSWNGKFHLEMHWWHDAHFAFWGRQPLLEKSLGYYQKILPIAQGIARRQGYEGARWPKMVGPDGIDSPSPIGPLLIWQQPHPIYYAELCYRSHPDQSTLELWKDVVEQSADFMASYAHFDDATQRYLLGPPLKTVAEHTDAKTAHNPTFELTYWRFGLETAQKWRQRLGQARNPRWDDVLQKLSQPPMEDGVYLMEEGQPNQWSQWNWEHPSFIGALGVLPGAGIDPQIMRATFDRVMQTWQWEKCWGWDFPMTAMCAARVGEPEKAIDALLIDSVKNRWLPNGHVYQRGDLTLYLPANGGFLTAIALMAKGWDGCPDSDAPGFPKRGWLVRSEGLSPVP